MKERKKSEVDDGRLRKSRAEMKNRTVTGECEKMKAKEKKEKLVKLGKLKQES